MSNWDPFGDGVSTVSEFLWVGAKMAGIQDYPFVSGQSTSIA
jgi:hypothetical protein